MKTYYNTMTNESFTLKQEQGAVSVEVKEGLRLVSVVDFESELQAKDFILVAMNERQVA